MVRSGRFGYREGHARGGAHRPGHRVRHRRERGHRGVRGAGARAEERPAPRGAHRDRGGHRAGGRDGARFRRGPAGVQGDGPGVPRGHAPGVRGISARRRQGRLLLRGRGAHRLPRAGTQAGGPLPRAHRHASDRRARRGPHGGRHRALRPGAVLQAARRRVLPRVHSHGQGAGALAEPPEDLGAVRAPHVLSALRVRRLQGLQGPRSQAERHGADAGRACQGGRSRRAAGDRVAEGGGGKAREGAPVRLRSGARGCYAAQCRGGGGLGRGDERSRAHRRRGAHLLDEPVHRGRQAGRGRQGAPYRRIAQRIGRGGALAPQRLRGPRARQLALGGGSGGVSGPRRPAPQAPPLHEAVGGRRRARFGARVHLPRGGRARRGSRIAEAAPSALRDGLAAQGRGATQGRRAQPERPGRPGESAKGQGLPGPLSLRPGRRQVQGRLAAAGPEILGAAGRAG